MSAALPNIRSIPKAMRPPALANVYRRKRPAQTPPAVKNVADAPFGIQQQIYMDVIGDNGKKSFIYPLQKLVFNYCDKGGSSKGIREYITQSLASFARKYPEFEIIVQPRPYRHPVVRAEYDNGFQKVQCVRNLDKGEIQGFVDQYMNSAGISPIKPKFPVMSKNESLRGIWTPFKDPKVRLTHKPQSPKELYSNNF